MRNRVSRRAFLQVAASGAIASGLDARLHAAAADAQAKSAEPDWAMNATIIEACSCTMFCPCYFSTVPSGHGGHGAAGEHFCPLYIGDRDKRGSLRRGQLDRVKFRIPGHLGPQLSQCFDPARI